MGCRSSGAFPRIRGVRLHHRRLPPGGRRQELRGKVGLFVCASSSPTHMTALPTNARSHKQLPEPALRLGTRPLPPMGQPTDACVQNAGICGTDMHIVDWDGWAARDYRPPVPLGHEIGAEVVAVGRLVNSVTIGQSVSFETHRSCGSCHQCRSNRRHTCHNLRLFSARDWRNPATLRWCRNPAACRGSDSLSAHQRALEPLGVGFSSCDGGLCFWSSTLSADVDRLASLQSRQRARSGLDDRRDGRRGF